MRASETSPSTVRLTSLAVAESFAESPNSLARSPALRVSIAAVIRFVSLASQDGSVTAGARDATASSNGSRSSVLAGERIIMIPGTDGMFPLPLPPDELLSEAMAVVVLHARTIQRITPCM